MADQKISELTNITGANLADADEFVVVDTSADQTKAVTRAEFFKNTPSIDVTGTVTADGLTVDGDGKFSGTVVDVNIIETDQTNLSTQLRQTAGQLRFRTVSNDLSAATERMRIDHATGDISFYDSAGSSQSFFWDASAERLGINSTTPTSPLTVNGQADFQASGTTVLSIEGGATNAIIGAKNSRKLKLQTATTTRLNIDDNGDLSLYDSTGTTPKFFWDASAESLGIGTSSPAHKIHVAGATTPEVVVEDTTNGVKAVLGADNSVGRIGTDTNHPVTFRTNDTERMRIDSSGNLLVGTTDADPHINSAGTTADNATSLDASGYLSAGRYQGVSGYFNRTGTDGGIVQFRKDGSQLGSIGTAGGDLYVGNGTRSLMWTGTSVFPRGGTGGISDATVDLGNGSNRFKDLYLSGGLRGDALTFSNLAGSGEAMRITSSGSVGIGTSTPDTTLHVDSGTVNNVAKFHSTDSTASIYLTDGTTTGGDTGVQGLITSGDSLEVRGLNKVILATGTTDRMTIDSSGNVGIGTSSPSAPLHIEALSNSGTGTPTEVLRLQVTEAPESSNLVSGDGTKMSFYVPEGDQTTQEGAAISAVRESGADTNASTALTFSTAADDAAISERIRIDSGGRTMIATSTSGGTGGWTFYPTGSGSSPYLVVNKTNGATTSAQAFQVSGVTKGSITYNSSSTAYNTSSDYRLKDNITPVQGAADIVKRMRPCTYTFKSDGSWADGFIAHELQELHPRAVTGEKDAVDEDGNPEYQGVDYSKLTPILTAALQEALTEIDALKGRITTLEG